MSAYQTKFERTTSTRVDEDLIRDLHKVVASFTDDEAQVSIELEDNHSISSSDIGELLSDPLVKSRPILHIALNSDNYKKKPPRRVNAWISTDRLKPVSVSIAGDKDACIVLRGQMEDLIDAKRYWYSWLRVPRHSNWSFALNMASGLLYFLLFLIVVIILAPPALEKEHAGWIGGIGFIVAAVATSYTAKVINILFPNLVFDFGRSARVARRAENLRSIIFGGIVLALVVGVASSLVVNWISK